MWGGEAAGRGDPKGSEQLELTEQENERAKAVWSAMTLDMREFVTGLVGHGMIDGRRGLAQCKVGPAGSLPSSDPATTVTLADVEILSTDERKARNERAKRLA